MLDPLPSLSFSVVGDDYQVFIIFLLLGIPENLCISVVTVLACHRTLFHISANGWQPVLPVGRVSQILLSRVDASLMVLQNHVRILLQDLNGYILFRLR